MTEPRPTEGELAILRVLWDVGPATVRVVHEALLRTKDTAYTTVLKMLTIMAEKGLVSRDESERSHRYAAAFPEPVVQASLLKDLMQRAFGGSALALVQRALESETSTQSERVEMASLIAAAKTKAGRP